MFIYVIAMININKHYMLWFRIMFIIAISLLILLLYQHYPLLSPMSSRLAGLTPNPRVAGRGCAKSTVSDFSAERSDKSHPAFYDVLHQKDHKMRYPPAIKHGNGKSDYNCHKCHKWMKILMEKTWNYLRDFPLQDSPCLWPWLDTILAVPFPLTLSAAPKALCPFGPFPAAAAPQSKAHQKAVTGMVPYLSLHKLISA